MVQILSFNSSGISPNLLSTQLPNKSHLVFLKKYALKMPANQNPFKAVQAQLNDHLQADFLACGQSKVSSIYQ